MVFKPSQTGGSACIESRNLVELLLRHGPRSCTAWDIHKAWCHGCCFGLNMAFWHCHDFVAVWPCVQQGTLKHPARQSIQNNMAVGWRRRYHCEPGPTQQKWPRRPLKNSTGTRHYFAAGRSKGQANTHLSKAVTWTPTTCLCLMQRWPWTCYIDEARPPSHRRHPRTTNGQLVKHAGTPPVTKSRNAQTRPDHAFSQWSRDEPLCVVCDEHVSLSFSVSSLVPWPMHAFMTQSQQATNGGPPAARMLSGSFFCLGRLGTRPKKTSLSKEAKRLKKNRK